MFENKEGVKMKIKILAIIICVCAFLGAIYFTASAEESIVEDIPTSDDLGITTEAIEEPENTETVTDESNEPFSTTASSVGTTSSLPGAPSDPTLYTRLVEFWTAYRAEIVSALGSAVLFILSVLVKFFNDKKTRLIASNVLTIKKDTAKNVSAQSDVVTSVNGLIEGYNKLTVEYAALKKAYEEYGSAEDERNRVVGALVAQNTAILEILTTVYVNSKNLPQGVKDLVNLKYSNCLKSLNDDTQLKAIIEAVRDNIGGNTKIESEEI